MQTSFSRSVEAGLVGGLSALVAFLDKLAMHIEEQQVEADVLLQARLIPNMFTFAQQISSAASVARRTVDRLSGKELKRADKPEQTIDALREHLTATINYIEAADAGAIDGAEARALTAKLGKKSVTLCGRDYLATFALPNFLFHVVTAYNILRQNGVDLGKHDYLRPLVGRGAQ
jgi:hypothetical protein